MFYTKSFKLKMMRNYHIKINKHMLHDIYYTLYFYFGFNNLLILIFLYLYLIGMFAK